MTLKTTMAVSCLIATAVLSLTGCGGPATPPTGKVSGIVTLDDQPLPKGQVRFMPDKSKGTMGRMAVGVIGSDGRFVLTSFKRDDGALVGFHKVVIICEEEVPPFDPKVPPPPPKSLIPIRYTDDKTSGMTAEVKSGAKNEFEFKLTTAP
jgi:hypothetical protein